MANWRVSKTSGLFKYVLTWTIQFSGISILLGIKKWIRNIKEPNPRALFFKQTRNPDSRQGPKISPIHNTWSVHYLIKERALLTTSKCYINNIKQLEQCQLKYFRNSPLFKHFRDFAALKRKRETPQASDSQRPKESLFPIRQTPKKTGRQGERVKWMLATTIRQLLFGVRTQFIQVCKIESFFFIRPTNPEVFFVIRFSIFNFILQTWFSRFDGTWLGFTTHIFIP